LSKIDRQQSLDHFIEAVQRALDRSITVEGRPMVVTASMGMAVYPEDAQDSIRLLRVADQRMYAAKHRPGVQSAKGVTGLKSAVVDSHMAAVAGGQR
jgi:GGDEF domain-containing protein